MAVHKRKQVFSSSGEPIVIDEKNKWIFVSEDDLLKFFEKEVLLLEQEYLSVRSGSDISDEDQVKFENELEELFENPKEIWLDRQSLPGRELTIFIGDFLAQENRPAHFHIAVTHAVNRVPTFIYLHVPTIDSSVLSNYQRGELIYDKDVDGVQFGAIDGDALKEGDELAVGLFRAMLQLRGNQDIAKDDFKEWGRLREATIEEADEIWRTADLEGNILVTFIKEFHDEDPEVTYIVVTHEEPASNVHALLFSFPTRDKNLVERYRHGDSLHSEEVSQESSH